MTGGEKTTVARDRHTTMKLTELDAQDRQAVAALHDGRRANWTVALRHLYDEGPTAPARLAEAQGWASHTSASRALRGLVDLDCATVEYDGESKHTRATYFITERGKRVLAVVSEDG